ncbi:polysaccharide deacetylase family protein [Azospirillum halopraeferens]|uniref:polysaccharide deacetylase family protein n=1 Tax=Azospirillum halopraeferens TaxID=34010 RepID=UPI0003FE8D4C|nr:polysaccharide deacetylase family protein [Azospirillum halopraeferens]
MLAGLTALTLAGAVSPLSAAETVRPSGTPAARTAPAASGAVVLQLGLFADEGSAWLAWRKLQRTKPELADGLIPGVVPLDPAPGAGVALRAGLPSGIDAPTLCRRIVGAGFGCLLLTDAVPVSPAPPVAKPAVPATPPPAAPPAAAPAAGSREVAFAPLPRVKPTPPPDSSAAAPAATPLAAATPPPAAPSVSAPVSAPVALAPQQVATIAAPALALAVKPPPPPVADGAKDGVPPAMGDGTFFYTPDEALELVEIEKRSRRLGGRLGAVLPDTRFEVAPAVLRRSEWNMCALTFDDGPHRVHTPKILEILNREKVRATYFPIARVAQNQPDIIKAFIASGHEIGSHSLTHANLRPMPAAAQRFEVTEANRILRAMGANPVLFRPPYGRYSTQLLSIIRDEGMVPVLWNVDTRDWQVRDPDKIVEHVRTTEGAASVLLMHSTYPSSVSALPGVIEGLRAKGCEFVTLSDWIEKMRTVATPMLVNTADPVMSANVPLPAGR